MIRREDKDMSLRVILASQSPRRQELLKKIFQYFEVMPSNADENIEVLPPAEYVEKLSKIKALEVYERLMDEDEMVPEVTGMKRLSKLFKGTVISIILPKLGGFSKNASCNASINN